MSEHDLEALVRQRLDRLDLETKVRLLTGRDAWTLHPAEDIGLASLVLSDGPAGVRGTRSDERDPSLSIPNAASLAATWDPQVVAGVGGLVGADSRRKGVHVLLAPTIGLHRSPLGGRNFEAWSEDPLLTGVLASAFVRGVQREGVGATAKHYVANDTETERSSYDARVAPDVLRERYLRPFEDLVRAGVWLVMASYNRFDGTHLTASEPLLSGVLKGEWGFDGVVVSDWYATHETEASATAGLDLVMPGPDGPWGDALLAAVKAGRVAESVVDDKVRRLLRLALRTGALDAPVDPPQPRGLEVASRRLREAAARGMVLLANDGVLPLDAGDRPLATVAVIGEPAVHVAVQGGGSAHVEPLHVVEPLDALREALGADRVVHAPGPQVARLLPGLPLALASDPVDGQPGVRLQALDADGRVLLDERRLAAGLPPLAQVPDATAVIRLRTDLRLPGDDSQRLELGLAALGRVTATLDGELLADTDLGAQVGDPVEAFMRPPEHRFAVDLDAGRDHELVVEAERITDLPMSLGVLRVGARRGTPDDDTLIAEAVEAARAADVAVVVVGTNDDVESEGFDRPHLRLPGRQDDLVAAVAAANPRTVVVVNAGSVYELPWAEDVAALLWAGLPGQEAGGAIADVLTGAAEPSGRLPTTFPRTLADAPVASTQPVDGVLSYDEGHRVGYAAHLASGVQPRFAFGHGLGYTTWSYEAAALERDGTAVLVRVRNAGQRAGREVVQVYLRPPDATTRLVGFASVQVEPGRDEIVRVDLDRRAASCWHLEAGARPGSVAAGRWSPLLGGELAIGRSATDVRITLPVDRLLGA